MHSKLRARLHKQKIKTVKAQRTRAKIAPGPLELRGEIHEPRNQTTNEGFHLNGFRSIGGFAYGVCANS